MFPTNQNAQNAVSKIPEALSKGTSGVIILPQNPTQDAIAAACSLYLGLSKLGKNVTIACSSPIQGEFIGAEKIQNNISTGGDNLVISFPFKEEALDKVDYGFQGDYFNVIVTPRPGQPRIEPSNVKYSYTGGSLDFIFTVDAPNLNSIGQLYAENQNEFAGKNIINIDRHLVNDMYGTVNYVIKTASSTSELVFKVLQVLQVELDKEIATNLYTGLTVATNNFTSYSVNADTFEAASTLLKAGAMKRAPIRQAAPGINGAMPMPGMQMPRPMQGQGLAPRRMPMPIPMDDDMDDLDDEAPFMPAPQMQQPMRQNVPMQSQPMPRPQQQPQPLQQAQPRPMPPQQRPQPRPQQQPAPMQQQPRPQPRPQQQPRPQHQAPQPPQMRRDDMPVPFEETMKPIEDVESQPGNGSPEAPVQTPQDWLKPKIFKGGGGLV